MRYATTAASLLVITLVLWIVNLCITLSPTLRRRLYPALKASVLVHLLNFICISAQGLAEIANPDDRSMLFGISAILTIAVLALTGYTVCAIFGRQFSTTPGDGGALDDGGAPNAGDTPNVGETLNAGHTKKAGATIKAPNKRPDSGTQSNTSDPVPGRFSNEPRPLNTRTLDNSEASESDNGTPSIQGEIADTSKPADTGKPSDEPRRPGGPSVPGPIPSTSHPFFANPQSNGSTLGLPAPPDDPTTGQKGKGRAPDADLEAGNQALLDDPATGLSNTAQKGNVRITDTELEEGQQVEVEKVKEGQQVEIQEGR